MKIQEQDIYYGAVLQQLAEHPVFTTINKATRKKGLYLINDSIRLLIKYSTETGSFWSFKFSPDDLDQGSGYSFFVALNCGNESICVLGETELFTVLDPNASTPQRVRVQFDMGESIRVSGPMGDLDHTIPHNAFPMALLGRVEPRQEVYAWPELSQLTIYREPPEVFHTSTDRLEDLADLLGPYAGPNGGFTAYLGLSTHSDKWTEWGDEQLEEIESKIKYDLNFDGYKVKIKRHTKDRQRSCDCEFLWKLEISI